VICDMNAPLIYEEEITTHNAVGNNRILDSYYVQLSLFTLLSILAEENAFVRMSKLRSSLM